LADATAERVIDASGMLLTPGFVNTHEHLWGYVTRGAFLDEIDPSLIAKSCTLREKFITDEDQYVSTLGSLSEFLKYETTCLVNPGDAKLAAVFKAYEQSDARVMVGQNYSDEPN
jgi:5-methylthioadenosine/S-adenosylhomocysteine deaminase